MTRLSVNVVASVGAGAECMSFPHARLFRAVHPHLGGIFVKARALPGDHVELLHTHTPVYRVVDRNRIWTSFVRSNFEYRSPCNNLCLTCVRVND
jgi:hypothetical protein